MGHSFKAICNDCQLDFEKSDGGGFFFYLLRCDRCGEDKCIGFDEIGEPHLQYFKGLPGPYCVVSSERHCDTCRSVRSTRKTPPASVCRDVGA